MKRTGLALVVIGSVAAVWLAFAGVATAGSEKDAAKLLVKVLRAGRIVVSDAQFMINDPSKGDKGFTSDAFEDKWKAMFKKKYNTDMEKAAKGKHGMLVAALIKAGKRVVDNAQPLINRQGMGFKGFLPALWGRKTGQMFQHNTGVSLKQTSVHYRYAGNKPDSFEEEILKMFADVAFEKGRDYSTKVIMKGTPVLRYMSPEYAARSCLKCHGEPKGEKDITGMKKEGYKEGDLAGAISVVMPVQ